MIHMKKRLFLILSVTVMLAAGCGSTDNAVPDMEPEAAETVVDVVEPDMTENKEVTAAYQAQNGDTGKEQTAEEMAKEPGQEKEDKGAADTPEPKTVSQPERKGETEPAQSSADVQKQEETKPGETGQQEQTEPEETKQQEQTVTILPYDPVSVCSQAVAKCQAGGMITTTDNLASLLAEGKITQEEYHSYYPYDGLGYYSVFVETDLNAASTMSGRKLGSEDGIADYIAGMMMLETEPVFYIDIQGCAALTGQNFMSSAVTDRDTPMPDYAGLCRIMS